MHAASHWAASQFPHSTDAQPHTSEASRFLGLVVLHEQPHSARFVNLQRDNELVQSRRVAESGQNTPAGTIPSRPSSAIGLQSLRLVLVDSRHECQR